MSRPAVLTAAAVALAVVGTVPVAAAPRRPADRGSYDVTVLPDPTGATADAPVDDPYARCGAVGGHALFWEFSEHGFAYRPPAAGTLTVTLRMKDPTGAGSTPTGSTGTCASTT